MSEGATWRSLAAAARARLAAAGHGDAESEARHLLECVSGLSGAQLVVHYDDAAPERAAQRLDGMVERRVSGEPLQYVLGSWGFRSLDVFVDRRVLIPRPETELVAGVAIDALAALGRDGIAVDLGTGSGVIALSMAAERWPHVAVYATDADTRALVVARANLAGLGRRAANVRVLEGDWYAALPPELAGRVDVIVSNPPYVAEGDELPNEVAGWEPRAALVPGPSGLEAIEHIVAGARQWLAPGGLLVVEIGETQGLAVRDLATRAGLVAVEVRRDLAGRDRILVARAPT